MSGNGVLVSFVVTNHNYARYLPRALDSLLTQTHSAIEIVIVDDHSSDDSRSVIAAYARDPRVRVVLHDTNRGSIASYNEGLALARGEFVGVFDADDYALRADAVARQVALFLAHPRLGFVYSAFTLVDEHDVPFRESAPWSTDHVRPGLDAFVDLLALNTVPHSGTLVRRSCHDTVGWYDPRLPYAGDWELWLRLAARYDVGYLATPLYAYRVHRNNMTSRGKAPAEATRERLLAVERAFASLPPDAPSWIRRLESTARRHALLTGTWNDRSFGRTRRSWEGLLDAVRRDPTLLATRDLYGATARLTLLTLVGHARYERIATWRSSHGSPASSTPSGRRIA
ncbi:MAG TPA: glycosyltransferase [Candidatus Acidoferrales bacterium]|nr:glycosyltransferase [Candidatus Acidoferrales bacterium]